MGGIADRLGLSGQVPGDWMGVEQERRIGVGKLPEPPDQRVAGGSAFGPPLAAGRRGGLRL
jgi:hypothetical protein